MSKIPMVRRSGFAFAGSGRPVANLALQDRRRPKCHGPASRDRRGFACPRGSSFKIDAVRQLCETTDGVLLVEGSTPLAQPCLDRGRMGK